MKQSSFSINRWYNERPLRERLLLLICCLVVLVFVANQFVLAPLAERSRSQKAELAVLQQQKAELVAREMIVKARKASNPDRENQIRMDALELESQRLQAQLEAQIVNLVSPREMSELLKALLTRQNRLSLVRLENLAPERIHFDSNVETDSVGPNLYRHSLLMEFSGDYLTLLTYLRQLETLPKGIILEEVEIESNEYPASTVRMQVSTLSLTEDWIGG